MRIVQENVRNITEKIATDVREKWIDFGYYDSSSSEKTNHYTGSGNSILAIQWGDKYYPMKNTLGGPIICNNTDQTNISTQCYMGMEDNIGNRKALSDGRVSIENIRFFISGNPSTSITNLSQEGKVTIILSLRISTKAWVNSEIAKITHMNIETTISEKIYKQN